MRKLSRQSAAGSDRLLPDFNAESSAPQLCEPWLLEDGGCEAGEGWASQGAMAFVVLVRKWPFAAGVQSISLEACGCADLRSRSVKL